MDPSPLDSVDTTPSSPRNDEELCAPDSPVDFRTQVAADAAAKAKESEARAEAAEQKAKQAEAKEQAKQAAAQKV